ncbi:hypothetical protein EBS80_01805 [bacterium]|nr:hypothetical protein [bacterium]
MGLLMLAATAWAASCPTMLPAEFAADTRSSGRVILVVKDAHALGVYDGDALVPGACYDVKLGGVYTRATATTAARSDSTAAAGPKRARGDKRTPEGWYEVSVRDPTSGYHLGLEINYPNYDDVMYGVQNGVLTYEQAAPVFSAIVHNQDVESGTATGKKWIVPQNTPLGGNIRIHGAPNAQPYVQWTNDWTDGCVALSNRDLDDLDAFVGVGTAVLILPTLGESESAAH